MAPNEISGRRADGTSHDRSEKLAESRSLAKSGGVSFAGAAVSALMGFVLTFIVARAFGEYGAGTVLQSIAIFSITLGLVKSGMDSVGIWLMPRLMVTNPDQIRAALTFMLSIVVIGGVVGAIGLAALAPVIAGPEAPDLRVALRMLAWFVPPGAVMITALAATRGLGGILTYVLVGSIGVPVARPVLVVLVAALGGTAGLAVGAWALPVTIGMVAALLVLGRQVRDAERRGEGRRWWPPADGRRSIVRFAVPRTISVGLEQSVLWLDVVLVGVLAGTAPAGVYGGASRLIAAGLIIDTAIRVVVSPRFSSFLHQGKLESAQWMYRLAAMWLVIFSTPIYIVLGVFATAVLGWFGPGFVAGSTALGVLAIGSIITMAAGNVHSVLLMSGHSGWAAFNKFVVLVLNVIMNIVLVPMIGIIGAAIAWAVSMVVDALLAIIEVRWLVGVRVELRAVGYALIVPLVTVGGSAVLFQAVMARDSMLAMALTILVGGSLLLGWCVLDRRRLGFDLWRSR